MSGVQIPPGPFKDLKPWVWFGFAEDEAVLNLFRDQIPPGPSQKYFKVWILIVHMNKYWFKPKTYGWGYVPISIEGWIATLIVLIVALILAYINNIFNPLKITIKDGLLFTIEIIILGFAFVKILEMKCKGKLKWRWGKS